MFILICGLRALSFCHPPSPTSFAAVHLRQSSFGNKLCGIGGITHLLSLIFGAISSTRTPSVLLSLHVW